MSLPTESFDHDTIADVLEAAALLLEQDGWCRGTMEDENGRHCAAGAILRVTHPRDSTRQSLDNPLGWAAIQWVERRLGWCITAWNDDERHGGAPEVIQYLRIEAVRLRERAAALKVLQSRVSAVGA